VDAWSFFPLRRWGRRGEDEVPRASRA